MNQSERKILKLLTSRESSAIELARHLEKEARQVERVCERLVNDGLVEPIDGDPVTYRITDAGRSALE